MSRSQRNKGARGEREAAAWLTDELGIAVRRRLGQARDSGHDITVEGPGCTYFIEVKRRDRIAVEQWLRQAETAAQGTDAVPIVLMRADGSDWMLLCRASALMTTIRESLQPDPGGATAPTGDS